tara:strand:+ start:1732 stop:1947 length:216 start_codon:yes stop_codon:yes gene_type:complete
MTDLHFLGVITGGAFFAEVFPGIAGWIVGGNGSGQGLILTLVGRVKKKRCAESIWLLNRLGLKKSKNQIRE